MLPRRPLGRERLWSGQRKRRCCLVGSPQDHGWHLHPQPLLGQPGWDRGQNTVSPPSAPFSLPSLLQLGWELGRLAMGAEEAIWRAQSPTCRCRTRPGPPHPAAGFQEFHTHAAFGIIIA